MLGPSFKDQTNILSPSKKHLQENEVTQKEVSPQKSPTKSPLKSGKKVKKENSPHKSPNKSPVKTFEDALLVPFIPDRQREPDLISFSDGLEDLDS